MQLIARALAALLLLAHLCCATTLAKATENEERIWIFIDTQAMTLNVMQGQKTLQTFADISIGRSGTTHAKQAQDGKTPLGSFHISHFIENSPFQRFLGLDYPNLAHSEQALHSGRISEEEFTRIRRHLRQKRMPPQNTALGGHIGIHGIGKGDTMIHEEFNWTNGCVALTNEQLNELNTWVSIGTRVVIH